MILASQLGSTHRGHGVWTDIVWDGGRFEITHQIHAADALTISRHEGGTADLDLPENLARIALYVEQRFTLMGDPQDSEPVTIGAETEADWVYVYQEWLPENPPGAFPEIDNRVLIDLEPDAQRFVRITGPDGTEERRF